MTLFARTSSRRAERRYDRDETPVVVVTDGGSYMRHSDSCPRDCGLCDDEDPTRTDEYEDIRDSEAIRADIREEFLGRVLSRDINPWQLVSPDAKTLWVYADGGFAKMDRAMYWDGSGIEPVYFSLINTESLQESFDYENWDAFVEECEDSIKDVIVERFVEANEPD